MMSLYMEKTPEYLSSIVIHTVLVAIEYVKTCKTKTGVSIIDSIPHCSSDKRICQTCKTNTFGFIAVKRKTGVSIIDSIPHCSSDKR